MVYRDYSLYYKADKLLNTFDLTNYIILIASTVTLFFDITNMTQLFKDLSKNIYDEEVRAEFESEVSYQTYHQTFMVKRFSV